MVSFVYLRNEFSRAFASELFVPGYCVHEAFSLSEAVWLCTQQHLGIVVIADNFEDPETGRLQSSYITMSLKPDLTVKDFLWELALLLPEQLTVAC